MGIFNTFKSILAAANPAAKPLETNGDVESIYREEVFYVAGVSYYMGEIKKLACCNSDWKKNTAELQKSGECGKRIFRYNYINKPVKLISEPNNPNDSNAVMVQIAGEKVGYICRDENVHVKNILYAHEVKFISSFISGGQYKIVSENGDIEKLDDSICIKIKIGYK